MQSPAPTLQDHIALVARDVSAARDGIGTGLTPDLDGMGVRAARLCRDIVESPRERARSCAPALEALLAELDGLVKEIESHREQLTHRLAAMGLEGFRTP